VASDEPPNPGRRLRRDCHAFPSRGGLPRRSVDTGPLVHLATTVPAVGQLEESPKQPQPERLRDWYPYYAGFPSAFACQTLDRYLSTARHLLDPWNGSGTTTALAADRGIRFTGLDVNPAATVVARARLTPTSIRESLEAIALEIVTASERAPYTPSDDDALRRWLREPAVASVRRLQRGINDVVVRQRELEREFRERPNETANSLPVLASFYYASLFAAVRDVLQRFRGTNPTWLRFPASSRERLNPSSNSIGCGFVERSSYLAQRLVVRDDQAVNGGRIFAGSVLDLVETNTYDGCLTSPPYATRVDYVRSSLAELSVLGLSSKQLDQLRLATTGSPRVKGRQLDRAPLRSATANRVTKAVYEHSSHGSASYYGPWISAYFSDLESSFERIHTAVQQNGRIGVVVQDSYYKSFHIDLQTIVAEAMEGFGRSLQAREDYGVRHLFSRINPEARRHLPNRTNQESLLVFA
jgi:hypothetical protein